MLFDSYDAPSFQFCRTLVRFIFAMMMGDKTTEEFQRRRSLTTQHPALHHPERPVTLHGLLPGETAGLDEQQTTSSMEAFGLDILKEEDEGGQIQ